MRQKQTTMNKKANHIPVTIFAGSAWESALLKSMLEDVGIDVFLRDEAVGTLAPWYTGSGGTSAVKVVIADTDLEKAGPVVELFEKNRAK